MNLGCRGQPVLAGQVDVEDRDIGSMFPRSGEDVVPGSHFGDHFDVGFESQQRDQSTAHHVRVLGKQHSDQWLPSVLSQPNHLVG